MIRLLDGRQNAAPTRNKEQEELREEIREVRRQLECVDSCFDMLADDGLLDCMIYQRTGLMARYRYLLRKAKGLALAANRQACHNSP